jgi:Transposase
MEISLNTPNGLLAISGTQTVVAWVLMNLPEGQASVKGKAPKATTGTRKRYTKEEKASLLKAATESGNMTQFAKDNGISYASLFVWKAQGKKKK